MLRELKAKSVFLKKPQNRLFCYKKNAWRSFGGVIFIKNGQAMNFKFILGGMITLFFIMACGSQIPVKVSEKELPAKPPAWETIWNSGVDSFKKGDQYFDVNPQEAVRNFAEAITQFEELLEKRLVAPGVLDQAKKYIGEAHLRIGEWNFMKGITTGSLEERQNSFSLAIARTKKAEKFLPNDARIPGLQSRAESEIEAIEKLGEVQEKYGEIDFDDACRRISQNSEEFLREQKKYTEILDMLQTIQRKTKYSFLADSIQKWERIIKQDINRLESCRRPTTLPQPVNQLPVANAGSDQIVFSGNVVMLNGLQSRDPDDDALIYKWSQIEGTPIMLSDSSSARPTFAPVRPGKYVFRLIVSDGRAESQPDFVIVFNKERGEPPPPSCIDLGKLTHDGVRYGQIIKTGTIARGEVVVYCFTIAAYGDLNVFIPPGYQLDGSGLNFAGEWRTEGDNTIYKRYVREKIQAGTRIDNVSIKREVNSPDHFQFVFRLYPR
jgi:hypothetical protein